MAVAIGGEHRPVRQQRPGFLRRAGVALGGGGAPGQQRGIEQGALAGVDIADQQRAVRQYAAGRVAHLRPAGGRRQVGPAIGFGIVEFGGQQVRRRIGVGRIVAAAYENAAIGQHRGGEIQAPVAGRSELGPASIGVVAGGVGCELPPIGGEIVLGHQRAVCQQQDGADIERREARGRGPGSCHILLPPDRFCRPAQACSLHLTNT